MANVGDSSNVLKERLKCKICENGVKAGKLRWFRCLKQHQICETCKVNAEKCPCGKDILEDHCEIIEELLKSKTMQFSCANESRGCPEVQCEESMLLHENECVYRLVQCPNMYCKSKVPFNELLEHMKISDDDD